VAASSLQIPRALRLGRHPADRDPLFDRRRGPERRRQGAADQPRRGPGARRRAGAAAL